MDVSGFRSPEPYIESGCQPEAAVRTEGGGAEGVAGRELPHARAELCGAAVEERKPDPGVGCREQVSVGRREQERRQGKAGEAETRGVAQLRGWSRASHSVYLQSSELHAAIRLCTNHRAGAPSILCLD